MMVFVDQSIHEMKDLLCVKCNNHIGNVDNDCIILLILLYMCLGRIHGSAVERRSLAGELLSCAQPVTDR